MTLITNAVAAPEVKPDACASPIHIDGKAWEVVGDCGQWTLLIRRDELGQLAEYRVLNLDGDGCRRFHEVRPGAFGEPVLHAEPDFALDVPSGVMYYSAHGDPLRPSGKISGLVVKDAAGRVLNRFSVSGAKVQGLEFELSPSGMLAMAEADYFLHTLVEIDKNRHRHYAGFFSTIPPVAVLVMELEDLF